MKKIISFALCLCMLSAIVAGCGTTPNFGNDGPVVTTQTPTTQTPTTTEDPGTTYTFDVGFSVTMDAVLEEQQSQLNDFYALGNDGTFAIICNLEPISDYESLDEYATLAADANGATAEKAADGNYFLNYINEQDDYHFYTAIRQGAENYYRVAFYCPTSNWSTYDDLFPLWAETVTVQ